MNNRLEIFDRGMAHFQGNPTMAARLVKAREYLHARGLKPRVRIGPHPGMPGIEHNTPTPRTLREAGL